MILVILKLSTEGESGGEVREVADHLGRTMESAAGFLGIEIYTDPKIPEGLSLLTRWSDEESFESWRRQEDVLAAMGAPGDFQFNDVLIHASMMERVEEAAADVEWNNRILDAALTLARYLRGSRNSHYLLATLDGTIIGFNKAAAIHLKIPVNQLAGLKIWSYLSEDDAGRLWRQIKSGRRQAGERIQLNFIDAEHLPYVLECCLDVRPEYFVLVGELAHQKETVLRDHLVQLNSQLSSLTKENALQSLQLNKANAELEKALNELNNSFWHLRKISEFLPICMQCHKVRTAEAHWEDVAAYLNRHSLFLTHSLCPDCYSTMMEEVKRIQTEEKSGK